MSSASNKPDSYYVPAQSRWPIIAAAGLFFTLLGAGLLLNDSARGEQHWLSHGLFLLGGGLMAYMLFGWFGAVIRESRQQLYSAQMDRSFRQGFGWFIFTEVMFFAAFFGALFYVRLFVLPWLGGVGDKGVTGALLWPDFALSWPPLANPDNALFPAPSGVVEPLQLPLVNTVLLLTSSLTVTLAHHALRRNLRLSCELWLLATILLGLTFLVVQGAEYLHAYHELGLTLEAGIYGSLFFLLTGFHGAHVTLGTLMLIVMLVRLSRGHFAADNHFGFEAASWYWHFVDLVWMLLFVSVYLF